MKQTAIAFLISCLLHPGIAAARAKGLIICWNDLKDDRFAVAIEFRKVTHFNPTSTIVDASGVEQIVVTSLIREILEYPDLRFMNLATAADLAYLASLEENYLRMQNQYPKAAPKFDPLLAEIQLLGQMLANGLVRSNGTWMKADDYRAMIATANGATKPQPFPPAASPEAEFTRRGGGRIVQAIRLAQSQLELQTRSGLRPGGTTSSAP